MREAIEKVVAAFPPKGPGSASVDVPMLVAEVERRYQVRIPASLELIWREIGSGYFGPSKELFIFGDGNSSLPRSSFLEWNDMEFWRNIYPLPQDGGPIFFCETCFGEQFGFRWEEDLCIPVVFVVDSFESFRLANDFDEFVSDILPDRDSMVDMRLLGALVEELGPIPDGMHYAPIVSFLVGGSEKVENFHFETANVHFKTTVATYEALKA